MIVKKLAYKILGVHLYLRATSQLFLWLYRHGYLKGFHQFDVHYFVRDLIKEGDVVVDIGANLGYYTVIFSRLIGPTGKVHAVEPIGMYRNILLRNTRDLDNTEIYPFALGEASGKMIKMGIPKGEKHFRHGLMRVVPQGKEDDYEYVSEAEMRKPGELFDHLQNCDYIKCDVEGYEMHVLPDMYFLFENYTPILQVETSRENKNHLMDLLGKLGYQAYCLKAKELQNISDPGAYGDGDVFFIPTGRLPVIK